MLQLWKGLVTRIMHAKYKRFINNSSEDIKLIHNQKALFYQLFDLEIGSKQVKGQGQGHNAAIMEMSCHKDHACKI